MPSANPGRFRDLLNRLTEELRSLTGLDLRPKTRRKNEGGVEVDTNNPIEHDIAKAALEDVFGSDEEALRFIGRLRYYRKHLWEVSQSSSVELDTFKSSLQSAGHDPPNFYGIMFEVEVAASLSRKGIPFEKGERPDFEVEVLRDTVGIECTTGRIEGGGLPLRKLEARVAKKGKKDYMGLPDVVFVDATGVHYASAGGGKVEMKKAVEEDVKGALSAGVHQGRIGAAVAFVRMHHDGTGNPETIYYRTDHIRIGESLQRFLDSWYPFGEWRKFILEKISYLPQR